MAGSGANTVKLAKINPILGSGRKPSGLSLLNPSYLSGKPDPPAAICAAPSSSSRESSRDRESSRSRGRSRDRDRKRGGDDSGGGDSDARRKKRRSRWGGDENDKTFIPGMPTILPTNLNKSQEEAYLIQLQIEDFSRRLRSGDLGISSNPDQRSPSPEPIYSSDGKRLNTREYRTRRRLEDDRHKLIQKMYELNPEYKPPIDYKPPTTRVTDKIVIPQEEYPDINFVGLLIGPRGNTLKSLEKDSGAKIILRGKGSVKEGKVGRMDGLPMPGEDEPLHAIISSINPECVKKAVDRIKEIIRQGVEVPEDQNDLRKNQLRELALLNGTLREQEGPRCHNCGATNHKSWQCPDKPNVTNNVICNNCGGAGHIARDCRQRRAGATGAVGAGLMGAGPGGDRTKIDEEYLSLMAELGEGPPPKREENRPGNVGGVGGAAPTNGGGFGNRFAPSNQGRAFESRPAPRPLMGPLTGPMGGGNVGSGDAGRSGPPPPGGRGWGQSPQQGGVNSGPPPRSMLNQPPPSGRGPPPTMGGWPGGQGPPQGPPPSVSAQSQPPQQGGGGFNSGPPPGGPGGMFQSRPPPPGPGGPAPSGGGSGPPPGPQWRAPWGGPGPQGQQGGPPPGMGVPPPPGPVPPPRPVGPPAVPPPQMYSGWQPQFGGPPPPPPPPQQGQQQQGQQQRPRPDLNMLAQTGLSNLLAAPPPPPPS